MMQARLSQCYDKVNTVLDKSAVEVYLHAFPATMLDGNVPLNSTSEQEFTTEITTGTYWISGMP
jgi:hypothetical protein